MATSSPALENVSLLNALVSLPKTLFGSESTVKTSGGTETKQTMLSQDAVNALLKGLMEDERTGLAKVASGARIPGMYNTTTQQLMINDLLARSAAEVAKAGAPTVTTKTPTTAVTKQAGAGATGLLGLGALLLGTKKGKELIGLGNSGTAAPVTDAIVNPVYQGASPEAIDLFSGYDATSMSMGSIGDLLSGLGDTTLDLASASVAIDVLSGGSLGVEAASGLDLFSDLGDTTADLGGSLYDASSMDLFSELGDTTADLTSGIADVGGGGIPYLGAALNLAEGDVSGAVLSGIGYAVGGPIGGLVGGVVDSILGDGCFITTAVCLSSDKEDDCYELQALRKFRDDWMMEKYPEQVEQYYREAPVIVSKISAREDASQIFKLFDSDFIQPAVAAIEVGMYELAHRTYVNLFDYAKELANG